MENLNVGNIYPVNVTGDGENWTIYPSRYLGHSEIFEKKYTFVSQSDGDRKDILVHLLNADGAEMSEYQRTGVIKVNALGAWKRLLPNAEVGSLDDLMYKTFSINAPGNKPIKSKTPRGITI